MQLENFKTQWTRKHNIMLIVLTIMAVLFTSINACSQEIPYDKKAHFVAGAWVSACAYPIVYSITKDKKKAFLYSLGASTLVGLGKEILDSTKPHNRFDSADLGTTILGGFMVSFTFEIL